MPGLEDVYLEIYYNILVVEQVELKENKKPLCKYITSPEIKWQSNHFWKIMSSYISFILHIIIAWMKCLSFKSAIIVQNWWIVKTRLTF